MNNYKFHHLTARGFRMPAEWEPHRGTWLSYPHNPKSFFTALAGAQDAFLKMVVHLSEVEEVHINVNHEDVEISLRRKLARRKSLKNVFFHRFPTNDAWCRDHGCIVLKHQKTGKCVAMDLIFNAWGGKYPAAKDNRIARKMAMAMGLECFSYPFVFEGGAVDVNGQGVMLTTESCLLNKNRNPSFDKKQIEIFLKANFGIKKVLWLKEGIAGDDTDGHIDDIARFIDARTIVAVEERNQADENHRICAQNIRLLKSFLNLDGRPFRVVVLPMPKPVYFAQGERLPASYANFYIANKIVLVPVFGCPQDKEAVCILASLFKGRKIVSVDARDMIVGLGACHCLSQQIPTN